MSQSNLITRDSDHCTSERGVPVSRIRIDDLPIAEYLTPEQEALIEGAGLRSFRPSLEALEARDLMDAGLGGAAQAVAAPSNTAQVQQFPVFFREQKVIVNQIQRPGDLKQQLDQAIPPADQLTVERKEAAGRLDQSAAPGTGNLQHSSSGNSSGTAGRAEADSLWASMGIARTFQLETGTSGRDKIANAVVSWWEMQKAIYGGPFLANRLIDPRAIPPAQGGNVQ